MQSMPIDEIKVLPERQRKDLGDVETLASSIKAIGLINPITVNREGVLIAGERRLRACELLGWTSVEIRILEDLPPTEQHLIELEENLRRKDLTWQELNEAVVKYHRLKCAGNPKWTPAQTAEAVSIGGRMVTNHISVRQAIEKGQKDLAEADTFSNALGILVKRKERARSKAFAEVRAVDVSVAPTVSKAQGETALEIDVGIGPAVDDPAPNALILNVDCMKWKPPHTFNLIHCDFPYGVNISKKGYSLAKTFGKYEDNADTYITLLDWLCKAKFIDEQAHLIFWFSMDKYKLTYDKLTEAGWTIIPHPLIWLKSDNTGIVSDPKRRPRHIYECAFFGYRGDRKIVRPVADAIAAPTPREFHMSEKSSTALEHFMRLVVDESTVMLDPTCGSGSAVKAAAKAGASIAIGLEVDENSYVAALENLGKIRATEV